MTARTVTDTDASTRSDIALLIARVAVGLVMLVHGIQKVFTNGLSGTISGFESMGVPVPQVAGVGVAVLELVGGALLMIGAASRVIAVLNALSMAGALIIVHAENGFFASDGGYELVLVLALFSVVVALLGAGRYSADAAFARSRRGTRR